MNHPEDEKRLYHPCKDTCSGYKQGYEDGQLDVRTSAEWKAMEQVVLLAEKHTNLRCAEWEIENDFDVPYTEHKESCRLCALQHAIEELDRIREEGESG